MKVNKNLGKCFDHGNWNKLIWGDKCPCCTGKLGRKRKGEDNE